MNEQQFNELNRDYNDARYALKELAAGAKVSFDHRLKLQFVLSLLNRLYGALSAARTLLAKSKLSEDFPSERPSMPGDERG